jgi:LSD1 subclass zinc finger protein
MLVECKNCGAPLDVGSGARQVKCGYCRMASPVRSMRTLAAQAPADWRPPPVWTPPAQSAQPSVALYYSATTAQGGSGSLGLVVAGLAVMAVLVGAVAIFYASSRSSQSMSTGSGPDRRGEPIVVPVELAPDPGRLSEPLVVSTKTPAVNPPAARPASTPVRKVTPKPTAKLPPPPTAKPKPPPKSKCGCAPGDLMCAMKCAQK